MLKKVLYHVIKFYPMTNKAKESVRRIFRIFPTTKKIKPLVKKRVIDDNEFQKLLILIPK